MTTKPYIIAYKDADYTGTYRVRKHMVINRYHRDFLPKVQELTDQYDEVFVARSRWGKWGEWCETWANVNGKATIIKQGWS